MKGTDLIITTYFYDVVLFVAAATGLVRFKRLALPFRVLTFATVSSFLLVVLEDIFIAKFKSNVLIYHLEAITGFTFYAVIYYCLFTHKLVKMLIAISLAIAIPFSVINAIYLQSYTKVFPTYVNLPTLGILVVLSLLFFNQMLLAPSKIPLLRQGIFWYNTAILFYSTTKFLNIGLSNAYTSEPELDYIVFYLWYFTDYIFAILQGIALFTGKKNN